MLELTVTVILWHFFEELTSLASKTSSNIVVFRTDKYIDWNWQGVDLIYMEKKKKKFSLYVKLGINISLIE